MDCTRSKQWMHDYLDDELDELSLPEFKQHLEGCEHCRHEFEELKTTILLLKGQSQIKAPDHFVDRVMTQLPKEEMKDKWKRWIKGHPILVAASIFLFLMAGSFVSIWTEGRDQFYVSVPNMEQIYVDYENSTVVVPDDQVIEGDLVVRNGNVEIRGEVTGDVIVTDGQVYQASTAHIAGQVEEIDQFMRWVWYHAQRWIKEALQLKP